MFPVQFKNHRTHTVTKLKANVVIYQIRTDKGHTFQYTIIDKRKPPNTWLVESLKVTAYPYLNMCHTSVKRREYDFTRPSFRVLAKIWPGYNMVTELQQK